MDKQYVALVNYQDGSNSWKKGDLILLDPDLAQPLIGSHITPLYSAIKSGLYKPPVVKPTLVEKVVADLSDNIVPPEERKKKLLQNKLQAQIMAKKAELAQNQK